MSQSSVKYGIYLGLSVSRMHNFVLSFVFKIIIQMILHTYQQIPCMFKICITGPESSYCGKWSRSMPLIQ